MRYITIVLVRFQRVFEYLYRRIPLSHRRKGIRLDEHGDGVPRVLRELCVRRGHGVLVSVIFEERARRRHVRHRALRAHDGND